MNNINQHTAVKILMPALLAHGAYKSTTYKEPPVEQTPSEALILGEVKTFFRSDGYPARS